MSSNCNEAEVSSVKTSGTGSSSGGSSGRSSRRMADGSILLENGQPTGSSVVEPNSVEYDGRTFHGYDEGAYLLPNDGPEQDRLDLQHAMFTLILDGQFGLAPFEEEPPRCVLDIATGTGIWPLEFARQHPESHVVGTDLSLIQPYPDVPNCVFLRENSEGDEWIFPYFFDYIHCRYCVSCFNDMTTVMRKAFDYLSPGGYAEFFDVDAEPQFEGDNWAGSAWVRYGEVFRLSMENQGRDGSKARRYKSYLEDMGFVDVTETIIPVPASPWMKDPKFQKIGMFARADCKVLLPGLYRLFMTTAGMTQDEVTDLIHQCIRELDECKVHFWFNNYVVVGRKPHESEMTDAQKTRWQEMQQKVAQLQDSIAPDSGGAAQ